MFTTRDCKITNSDDQEYGSTFRVYHAPFKTADILRKIANVFEIVFMKDFIIMILMTTMYRRRAIIIRG